MDDYSIMWPQSSPAVHTYTVATHRVTPVDIYKVTLLMERRPLDKRRQHVHLHKGTKICKNVQSFLEIRMCVHTNEHNMSYLEIFWHHTHTHTHTFLQREAWALFNPSLFFVSAEHSEKQREAEKHVMQEGAYCAMKGTDWTSHKPLGPSFTCLLKKKKCVTNSNIGSAHP